MIFNEVYEYFVAIHGSGVGNLLIMTEFVWLNLFQFMLLILGAPHVIYDRFGNLIVSIHAPRMESTIGIMLLLIALPFQFMFPVWGAFCPCKFSSHFAIVSIHAPHVWSI